MALLFGGMFLVLAARLFELQIIRGSEYQQNFMIKSTKEIAVKGTRGMIRDRNGVVLAENKMTYSVTFEDVQEYDTTRERQLALNGTLYQLAFLIEEHGDSVENHLEIRLDEGDNWQFTVQDSSLERFLADIYGKSSRSDLTQEERNASAGEVISYLEERYGLFESAGKPYTAEELARHGMPAMEELSRKEELNILSLRYALTLTSYQKYLAVTAARDISDETRAAVLENQYRLTGAEISEDSIRVYPQGGSVRVSARLCGDDLAGGAGGTKGGRTHDQLCCRKVRAGGVSRLFPAGKGRGAEGLCGQHRARGTGSGDDRRAAAGAGCDAEY